MRYLFFLLALLPLLLLCTNLHCAETATSADDEKNKNSEDIQINMYVDQAQASIGDEIVVHIDYQWPTKWTINENTNPAIYYTNAGAFLLDAPPVHNMTVGAQQQQKWTLTLLVQSSGAWSLPRPTFHVTDENGDIHTATAAEVIIQVGTEENPPRLSEISTLWSSADSADAGVHSRLWLWIVITVCIIGMSIYFLLPKKKEIIQLSPIEIFQQSFLRAQSAADGKEAAAELSQGLRRFCGHIWAFDGAAATNREMRSLLQTHITSEDLRHVCTLLDNIESVRWTAAEAQLSHIQSLAGDARNWCSEQYARSQQQEADSDTISESDHV